MNDTLKKILKPLASLYLTVPLLAISLLLVYAGTTAQKELGIQDVQKQYFHSFVAHVSFDQVVLPFSKAGSHHIPGGFPLPGGYTLILPNPSRRFAWLAGDNPDAIGVRVPQLTGVAHDVVSAVGAVVATSANMPGGRDPATLDEVPRSIRAGAGAEIDGGRVPGTPSTVVDLTGPEPCVLRPGALAPEEVLRRLDAAVRSS